MKPIPLSAEIIGGVRGESADALILMLSAKSLALASDALATIAADPGGLFNAALFAGIRANLFEDDLLLIYRGMEHAFHHARDQWFAIRCTQFLLADAGYWSYENHGGGGYQWTAKRLVAFFHSWYPSRAEVEHATRLLVEHHDRMTDIASHLQSARDLIAIRPDDVRWMNKAEFPFDGFRVDVAAEQVPAPRPARKMEVAA